MLDPGDGSLISRYEERAGLRVDPAMLTFYRYDLVEIGGYLSYFKGEHIDSADSAESFANLEHFLRPADR